MFLKVICHLAVTKENSLNLLLCVNEDWLELRSPIQCLKGAPRLLCFQN